MVKVVIGLRFTPQEGSLLRGVLNLSWTLIDLLMTWRLSSRVCHEESILLVQRKGGDPWRRHLMMMVVHRVVLWHHTVMLVYVRLRSSRLLLDAAITLGIHERNFHAHGKILSVLLHFTFVLFIFLLRKLGDKLLNVRVGLC